MPHIVGTGLLALDLIVQRRGEDVRFSASGGGTCGNVLTILAQMGWRSSWLGALDASSSGDLIRAEMAEAGVCLHTADTEEAPPVPVFAHHIDVDRHGLVRHWFSNTCPHCGRRLPRYRRPPDAWMRAQHRQLKGADVFFADRISEGVIELAVAAKRQGTLVVYEPSVASDAPWMSAMFALADVVKYSADRRRAFGDLAVSAPHALCIETRGRRGLRWWKGRTAHKHQVPAVHNPAAIDASGAGDWLTSALLFQLATTGRSPMDLPADQVIELMAAASRVAAWSCGFLGARGALYDAPVNSVFTQLHTGAAPSVSRSLARPEPGLDIDNHCAFA